MQSELNWIESTKLVVSSMRIWMLRQSSEFSSVVWMFHQSSVVWKTSQSSVAWIFHQSSVVWNVWSVISRQNVWSVVCVWILRQSSVTECFVCFYPVSYLSCLRWWKCFFEYVPLLWNCNSWKQKSSIVVVVLNHNQRVINYNGNFT